MLDQHTYVALLPWLIDECGVRSRLIRLYSRSTFVRGGCHGSDERTCQLVWPPQQKLPSVGYFRSLDFNLDGMPL